MLSVRLAVAIAVGYIVVLMLRPPTTAVPVAGERGGAAVRKEAQTTTKRVLGKGHIEKHPVEFKKPLDPAMAKVAVGHGLSVLSRLFGGGRDLLSRGRQRYLSRHVACDAFVAS